MLQKQKVCFFRSRARARDEAIVQDLAKTPALFFFHRALKRVFALTGEIHALVHLGLGDFVCKDAADADTAAVHVQHDSRGLLAILTEEPFQDLNHKLHWREIVIEQQDLIKRRLFGFRRRLGDDPSLRIAVGDLIAVAHRPRDAIRAHL